jgi:hypothetical protein
MSVDSLSVALQCAGLARFLQQHDGECGIEGVLHLAG